MVVSDGNEELEQTPISETQDLKIEENEVEEVVTETSINDDATVDVSDVIKKVEETIEENDSSDASEAPAEPPKKEKRGLFHFGRK